MWTLALHLSLLATPDLALFAAPDGVIPTVAHWELDGSLVSAVGGEPLTVDPPDAARFIASTLPDGQTAEALALDRGAKVHVPIGFTLRGPGYEGRWTVVMDVQVGELPLDPAAKGARTPAKKPTWRSAPLVQTDPWNDDAAELLVDRTRGLDVAGEHGGAIADNEWHRLAMVVDEAQKTVTGFVDGVMVRRVKTDIADSRWALEPEILLFADEQRDHPPLRLAALQVRTGAIAEGHIQALGAPTAAGLPRPDAPLVAWTSPPPASLRPGQAFTATFRVSPPAGEVALALEGDGAAIVIGKVASDAGHIHAALPPGAAAGKRHLVLRWSGDAGRAVTSPLEVLAPSEDMSLVGQELLINGGFDGGLDPWALTGEARVAPAAGANGNAVVGTRGDFALRQVVALPSELQGEGLAVSASARVKRKDRAGTFGDRGTLVVRFLAADGALLGSLRSMSVDKSEWHDVVAHGAIAAGTARLEVLFQGLERQGGKNEVALDQVALAVRPIDAGPVRLAKLPVLMPGQGNDEHFVVFETDRANVPPVVWWGPVDQAQGPMRRAVIESTTIDDRHQAHRAVLAPLTRGARYQYRVELADEASPTWQFVAPRPDDQPLSIAWLSDNQHGWRTFRQLVPAFSEVRPDLVMITGDIVQRGPELREWQTEWFSPLSIGGLAQTVPIGVARGNHDGDGALAHVYAPLPGNGHWYAFTRREVRFIVLDTEADAGRVPEQLAWLQAELGGADAKDAAFRVVAFHKAPFSNRWDSAKSKYDGEQWVRQRLVPLFADGKVDLVIAGHAHTYQRIDVDGVRYLVIGGAGGRLDRYKTGKWAMDKDFVGHHWAHMRIADAPGGAGPAIEWTARDFDGNVIDEWSLVAKHRKRASHR